MTQPKTILITGADGFVGQHAVRAALAQGHHVVALVRDDTNKPERKLNRLRNMEGAKERLMLVRGDITNEASMKAAFAAHPEIDAVIHAAALMVVPNTEAGKADAERINMTGTRSVAKAANELARAKGKVILFHYISSAHVLSQLAGAGAESFDPAKSLNTYGATKFAGEVALSGMEHLLTVTTYPPHLYGPDQEKPLLIPTLVRKGLRGQPMPIAGDGSQPMQYLHVDNFVADLLSTMNDAPTRGGHVRYAISGDTHTTVRGVAEAVCDELDRVVSDGRHGRFSARIQPSGGAGAITKHAQHGLPELRGERKAPTLKETLQDQIYHLLPECYPLL